MVLCALSAFTACTQNEKQKSEPEQFQVISPITIDTSFTSEYVADIQSLQNVEIRARVKGFIDKIYIDEGKPVNGGQTLFSISNQGYKEEVLKASALLKSAMAEVKSVEVELQNSKILVDKNVVAKSHLDIIQAKLDALFAKVEEAKANVSGARLQLSYAEIKAPFDGIINRIPYKTGSLVDEGALLTSLSNNKEVFAYFNVSEKEYLELMAKTKTGRKQEVRLALANNKLYPQKGTVETIEGEFDKSTGNIAFRARFANPDLLLKHGSSGKIQLETNLKNALLIPQKSTFEVQDKYYVYVVDEKNVVHAKAFRPRLRLDQLYVVESGLSPTDKIIFEGLQRVKEGAMVVVQPVLGNGFMQGVSQLEDTLITLKN